MKLKRIGATVALFIMFTLLLIPAGSNAQTVDSTDYRDFFYREYFFLWWRWEFAGCAGSGGNCLDDVTVTPNK
jgi:hypothetical protein